MKYGVRTMGEQELKSLETKNKILAATGRMLRDKSFDQLTVRNICDEAEAAYGSFYHHFGNKQGVLFSYAKQQFETMLAANPIPAEIARTDYIRRILWKYMVYGKFCERVGKPMVAYLYQNCSEDILLSTCLHGHIVPELMQAAESGYLRIDREGVTLRNILEDIPILLCGVMLYWSNKAPEGSQSSLCLLLERIMFRFLYGFSTEKNQVHFPTEEYLFSDDPDKWLSRIQS